jgi:hypothetical protein
LTTRTAEELERSRIERLDVTHLNY